MRFLGTHGPRDVLSGSCGLANQHEGIKLQGYAGKRAELNLTRQGSYNFPAFGGLVNEPGSIDAG
jgi:hypothetical protein